MSKGKCEVTGKTQYLDRRDARLALEKLRVRRAGHKTERNAYHCRFCDKWHITSMGERPNARSLKTRMTPHQRWKWNREPSE